MKNQLEQISGSTFSDPFGIYGFQIFNFWSIAKPLCLNWNNFFTFITLSVTITQTIHSM